jgi:hypothetical protein
MQLVFLILKKRANTVKPVLRGHLWDKEKVAPSKTWMACLGRVYIFKYINGYGFHAEEIKEWRVFFRLQWHYCTRFCLM